MGTFTKKIKLLILAMLFMVTGQVFAGAPNWDRVDYTSSTTFVGIIKITQYTQTFGYNPVAGDYIGAFVGNECRMKAQIFAVGSDLYVSSVIQGGDNCVPNEPNCTPGGNEVVTFRLWSNSQDKEYASLKGDTLTYPGDNIGSTLPYEIGKPKTGKDLLTLSINNVTLAEQFSPSVTSYTASVTQLPVLSDFKYTSSPRSTVDIKLATNLNGTEAERTTTITVTSESGYTKTYTIVYASGCTLTSTAPTLNSTKTSICIGENVSLTASGNGSTFTWYSDAAATNIISSNALFSVTPTATTTYYSKQSNSATCVSPVAAIEIKVNSLPNVLASATPASICSGSTSKVSATGADTYKWNTTAGDVNPTSTTTYYVTGTDANSCTNTSSVIVTVNSAPNVIASANPASICVGNSSTITASGADSYIWSQPTGLVSPTSTTTYTVTGTSATACVATASVVLTVRPVPTVTASATHTEICSGETTTVSAIGADTYVWNTTAGLVSPLTTTTYSVTGTNGTCPSTSSVVVTVNPSPVINLTATKETICFGKPTTITASGATNYIWDHTDISGTGNAVYPTTNTTYSVTGTNGGGCSGKASIAINVNSLPVVALNATPQSICKGDKATLSASGGISYTWSNNLSGNDIVIEPTSSTTYTVTGTDNNGCQNSSSKIIEINELPNITASANPASVCSGGESVITGNGGVSYIWNNNLNEGVSKTVSPTSATSYIVTGTDSKGCKNTGSVTVSITTPTTPVASDLKMSLNQSIPALDAKGDLITWKDSLGVVLSTNNPYTPTFDVTKPNVFKFLVTNTQNGCESEAVTVKITVSDCNVDAPTVNPPSQEICQGGSFNAFVATGKGIKWYLNNIEQPSNNGSFTPTVEGDYYVSQTDGCEGLRTKVTAKINALPKIEASVTPSSICVGSFATLAAIGGESYVWSINESIVKPTTTSTYIVTGTDLKGCKNTSSIILTVNQLPNVVANVSKASVCKGESVDVTAFGANTYIWNNASINGASTSVTPQSSIVYIVTGTDKSSCTNTASVSIEVNELPNITASANPSSVCVGNSSILTGNGGVSYVWNNNLNDGTSKTVTPTSATSYVVTGTDSKGCKNTGTVEVVVNSKPVVTLNAVNSEICNGKSTSITAEGALTYVWNVGNISGNTGVVDPKETTTYTVTGTDNNSCSNTASVTVNVTSPSIPNVEGVSKSIMLKDPIPTLKINGGDLITWKDSTSVIIKTGNEFIPSVNSNSVNTYKFLVTNTLNGCESKAASVTLTVTNCTVLEPTVNVTMQSKCEGQLFDPFIAKGNGIIKWYYNNVEQTSNNGSFTPTVEGDYYASQTDGCESPKVKVTAKTNMKPSVSIVANPQVICKKASSSIVASGAINYVWNQSLQGTGGIVSPNSTTQYIVTGSDANGCSNTASVSVSVTVPSLPKVNNETITVGQDIPTLMATGNDITWIDSLGQFLSKGSSYNPIVDNKTPNTFKFLVSNKENGCVSDSIVVTLTIEPASTCTVEAPTVNTNNLSVCKGESFGNLVANGKDVKWYLENALLTSSNGILTPTAPGNYYATQTIGCEGKKAKVTVVENSLPEVVAIANPSSICKGKNTELSVSGASTYVWNNNLESKSTVNISPAISSTYIVTGTGLNGCKNTSSVSVTVNELPNVNIVATSNSVCSGTSTEITTTGASTYVWSGGISSINAFVTPTAKTSYNVTGTDTKGCSNTASVVVDVNESPATLTANGATVCEGNNGELVAIGATGTINWYGPNSTVVLANTSKLIVSTAGVYKVSQMVNGCESDKKDVEFIVNKNPDEVKLQNVTINQNEMVKTINAGKVVNWYDENHTPITTAASYTPSINSQNIQTKVFYIDVTSSEGCKSKLTSFTFEVKSLNCPSAPSLSATSACEGSKGVITASGSDIKWYSSATSTTVLATGSMYAFAESGTYFATQSNTSCESQRTSIDVVIKAKPTVTMDVPALVTINTEPIVIEVRPIGGILSGDGISGYKFTPSTLGDNIINYEFTNSEGCKNSISKTIRVTTGGLDKTDLVNAINVSTNKIQKVYDEKLVGTTVGKYPQSAVDELNNAKELAVVVRDNSTDQDAIDNATKALTDAIYKFENSIIVEGNKDDLSKLIINAQNLISNSTFGTAINNYPPSAKTDLQNAVNAANAVKNNPNATQSDVDKAEEDLTKAINIFESKKIKTIQAESISFGNVYKIDMKEGESLKLSYTLTPEGATTPALTWTSSNQNVAIIDQNGRVTAVGEGITTIKVVFTEDPTKVAQLFIKVTTDVGIEEISVAKPTVYPTITDDVVYIKNAGLVKSVKVISVNGKVAKQISPKADVIIIDLTDLSNGAYIIVSEIEDGSFVNTEIIKK